MANCERCGRPKAATGDEWYSTVGVCGAGIAGGELKDRAHRQCLEIAIAARDATIASLERELTAMRSDRAKLLGKLEDAKWDLLP